MMAHDDGKLAVEIEALDDVRVTQDLGYDDTPAPDPEEGPSEAERREEIQSTVQGLLQEAIDHYEENLEPDQVDATDYYWARPFGDEVDGRSKVVSSDVRDTTLSQLPSLMRILYHREKVVEFKPRPGFTPEEIAANEAEATAKTDHVNRIITELNPGFSIFYATIKDALVRRMGYMKWWWEEDMRPYSSSYTGLTVQDLIDIGQDDEVELEILAAYEDGTFDATVTRYEDEGYERIAAVPPEEIVFSPGSRSIDEAPIFAHVRTVPQDELVALGIDKALIEEKAAEAIERDGTRSESLGHARQFYQGASTYDHDTENVDPSRRPVQYAEAYTWVDGNDDGIAELRLFQCIGADHEIVNGNGKGEIVDEIPFAPFTPDPEPHTIVGLSNYDLVGQLQRVKSQVERAQLNSLSQAVDSDLEVVQGEVNMKDVLSKETSKVIRVRKPGMLREVKSSFVGPDTLPVLAYYDSVREDRTGQSKASRGLEANALQSSTAAAVSGTFTKSQERIELIARNFAETGLTRLYRGLLRLAVKHRRVPGDPRAWAANDQVRVNLALGQGPPEQQLAVLEGILTRQEQYVQNGVPFVNFSHIRATLDEIVRLSGHRNPEKFFGRWTAQEQQQYEQQQAQQPPTPDPTERLVQLEEIKAQADAAVEQAKLALDREKMILEDDRERDRMAREMALREREAELKYKADINDAQLKADVAAARAAMDADLKREQAQTPTPGATQ